MILWMRKSLYFLLVFVCIKANAQLHADFVANNQQGCSPLVVQFTDSSQGNPTQWLWDLGNGATSTLKNPGAIYVNPGSYTIKLHIKNATGDDSIIKTNYIIVHENPSAAFNASPVSGCAPMDVNFTDKSLANEGIITNWIWDFGDGIISNEQNPAHTYNLSDTFDVLLTVTNSFGCKNTFQNKSLVKVGSVVQAGFSYVYSNACKPPATITFTNTSQSGSTMDYQWYFGDGSASTQVSPVHVFATSGNFTVKLEATNENGCTNTFQQIISIGSVKADFDFIPNCNNNEVSFTDISTPSSVSATWDFGDGNTGSGSTVNHIYSSAGTFQVTLNANFGGCSDTIRKTIKTGQNPQADFTSTGNRATCSYPETIQFNEASVGASGYQWIFGDGATSNEKNPSHTYKGPGQYSVKLIVFNSYGCSDTIVKTNYIQLGLPQIQDIQNLPFEGCAPQSLIFRPDIISGDSIISYQWDFGDSTISSDSVPIHAYQNVGIYDVRLIVVTSEGCSDTLFLPNAVELGIAPKPGFSADPLNVCANTPVQFKDESTGLITDWLWLFGDGVSSTEQNPSHIYTDTGYKDVTLIVSQYGCRDTLVINNYVYVNPPVAKFNVQSECNEPYKYTFTDKSIEPQSWLWDFGDGSTSSQQSPVHTYSSKGVFFVTLTVTNGGCTDIGHDSVNVVDETPSFNYKSVSSNFCKYDSIHFFATNYDADNIKNFQWDFGDGIITQPGAKNNDIYHLYTEAGMFSPILIVKDVNNCIDTIDKNIQIQIFGPNAAFSNQPGACVTSTITFTDESVTDGIHPILSWIWNYGDTSNADTLSSGPFTHTYITTGLYDVSLKIIDNMGCYDTISNFNAINITKPVAGFSSLDTLSCGGSPVSFVDSSKGVSLLYQWSFGDGQTSGSPEPIHKFSAEGLYDVKLVVHDKYGCVDSMQRPQYIRVANPIAGFLLPDTLFSCPPAKINPVNNSVNYTFLTWYFGDGNTSTEINPEHFYTSPGNYTLKLVTKGFGICYDTTVKPLVVKGPSAELSYSPFSGCHPLNISFLAKAKNTVGYIWDFGNGETLTSIDSFANYTYTKPGKYLPQLIVIDSGGCHIPVVNKDTIIVFGVEAKYSAVKQMVDCDSALYHFLDSSIALFDKINNYKWDFGDGSFSYTGNPSHYYHNNGVYDTKVYITSASGCIDSFALLVNVAIDSTPLISAIFPDSACVNAPLLLLANLNNNIPGGVSWKWDFGNGDILYDNDTSYSYPNPGLYNLSVIGTSMAGCADTLNHSVRIDPLPAIDAGVDTAICLGSTITLNATGGVAYQWTNDGTLSCNNCNNPFATPIISTTYFITGSNSFGCSNNDSVNIKVVQPANVSMNVPDTICVGSTIQMSATGAEMYSWEPASLVNNSADSVTTSTPLTTTTFTVIGKDSKGCFSDTASGTVNVFPYPGLQLKDSMVTLESGDGYQALATGTEDIISWQWSPPSGISCLACPNPVLTPASNQVYTVTVKNIAGCSTEKQITITVICKGQNLFIPNTFSPNGDGMNDYFYPRGKGFTVKSFRIFSRWGTIVFEQNNFPPNQQAYGWDGTYKNKKLVPDVYVFIAEILCNNGGLITQKGNVTLLR